MIIEGKYTTATVYAKHPEPSCVQQIQDMTDNEQFTNPIVIMPDCHAGYGSVIGFTMKLGDKLSPNVVGVDIGCGMLAVNLGGSKEVIKKVGTARLDMSIRNLIPMGMSINDGICCPLNQPLLDKVSVVCERVGANEERVLRSLRTLGGGNHFIEFSESQDGDIWLVIHTGSRNFGKKICDYWQGKAKELTSQKLAYMAAVDDIKRTATSPEEIGREIAKLKGHKKEIKKGLEYLTETDLREYLYDMGVAQEYAERNRAFIAARIISAVSVSDMGLLINQPHMIESVHNYINFEDNIIRKGAIQCNNNRLAVIPLNMRDGTLIVRGKGNPDWNYSAPHGAGRRLSRRAAKEQLSLRAFEETMRDVYSQSVVESTLDEAPAAYKDAGEIIAAIRPTATIIDTLRPLHNIKASE